MIDRTMNMDIHHHEKQDENIGPSSLVEGRYRSLVANVPDIITVVDIEGRIKFINKTELGYQASDFTGRTIFEVISPEYHQEVRTKLRHTLETGETTEYTNIAYIRGEPYWYDNRVGLIKARGNEDELIIISTNITNRKRIEEEFRSSRKQIKLMLSNLPGMAYRCKNVPGWPMDFVSEGCIELTGYHPDEFTDDSPFQYEKLINPNDRQGVFETVQASIAKGEPFTMTYRITTREGVEKYVWEKGRQAPGPDGSGTFLEGFIMDISENVEAMEALKSNQEKLESIFRVSPSGIGVVKERIIQEVNNRICEMTGYSRDELIGKSSMVFYPSREDFDYVGKEKYRQIAETGSGVVETRWKKKSGEIIYVVLASTPMIPGDNSKGVIFTALDISARKLAEEEQRKMEEHLRQVQKMETVGQLAGGVAHEFNNTLQVIHSLAELSLIKLDTDHPVSGHLQQIRTAVMQSSEMVGQLMAFARKQAVKPQVLDLNRYIHDMLLVIQKLIGERIVLKWAPGEQLWPVELDPSQVNQLLLNLVLNARDAIGTESGQIIISTANQICTSENCFMGEDDCRSGAYVCLSVGDNGSGIDPETMKRIFEPFFTTKPTGKGTGLGLATIYGIVRQNKGAVKVSSKPGEGTEFRIYFPRH